VLWYNRERGMRCGCLTRRSAFFDRRSHSTSLFRFKASSPRRLF
jgi:hypothetical protein